MSIKFIKEGFNIDSLALKDAGKITNKIERREETGNLNMIKHVFVNWLVLMVVSEKDKETGDVRAVL